MDEMSVQPMELLSEAPASARSIEHAGERADALHAIAKAQRISLKRGERQAEQMEQGKDVVG